MNDTIYTLPNGDFKRVELVGPQENCITFNLRNPKFEMLKITEDGFYVRGKKVPVDDKEALTVYKAFRQFLAWSALTRE